MDLFAGALVICAALFFGVILVAGFAALVQIRNGQRDRLQMKRHVQRIDVSGEK